jgi:hypothetical protein
VARKKKRNGAQTRISEKIAFLRREGKSGKEAAGEAYGMERSGRLGRHGVYRRVGKRGRHRKGSSRA